jgi:transposase
MTELLTITEASKRIGRSRQLVYKWVSEGKIAATQIQPDVFSGRPGKPAKWHIEIDELKRKGLLDG